MVIFFIDYHYTYKTNGIFKYRELLSSSLSSTKDIRWRNVLLGANNHDLRNPTVINSDIYVPYDIVFQNKITQKDFDFAVFIQNYICTDFPKEDVIFHINWMNHIAISCLLRKFIPMAKIVFTKHCVAWRENILTNYPLFYSLHSICAKKKSLPYPLKEHVKEELFCFEQADAVITVTEDAKNLLCSSYGIDAEKVFCIHNGITIYRPKKSTVSKTSYGFRKEDKIMIYAGSIIQYKGLRELLQLFHLLQEQVSNLKLLICGSGEMQWFLSMLEDTDIGQIHFTGHINNKELRRISQIADIAIVPSLIEQCSFSALEFLASDIPVVLSDIDGLQELHPVDYQLSLPIEYEKSKISAKYDKITNHIVRVLENPDYRKEIIASSHAWIKQNFSTNQMISSTKAVYEKVLYGEKKERHDGEPLVSVIIPCHNGEKHILQSIESVVSQSYTNIEIIIIDDSSKDRTLSIIKKITDPRLKVLSNPGKKGVAYSLNRGIENAKGKYIARLDSDGIMHPCRIRKQVDFLEKEVEFDFVGSNHFVINDVGLKTSYTIYPEKSEEIALCRFLFNPISPPTALIRRTVLLQYMYCKKDAYCKDYFLWMVMLRKHKGYNLQEGLTLYRSNKDEVPVKNSIKQREYTLQIVLSELEHIGFDLRHEDKLLLAGLIEGAPPIFWRKYQPFLKDYVHRIAQHIGSPLSSLYLSQLYSAVLQKLKIMSIRREKI